MFPPYMLEGEFRSVLMGIPLTLMEIPELVNELAARLNSALK